MVSTVQAALGDLSAEERADFFGETARRVYLLPATIPHRSLSSPQTPLHPPYSNPSPVNISSH